jgi:hypothetical protein
MRKVHLVEQSTYSSCGPASLAMLAGTTEKEVMKLLGPKRFHGVAPKNMLWALDKLDVFCSSKWLMDGLWYLSPKALLIHEYVKELNGKHPIWAHYIVYYKGKFYDPADGIRSEWFHSSYTNDWQKITAYVDIYD